VIALRPGAALVAVERSGVIESVHRGHLLVVGADGADRAVLGDVDQPVYLRSCAKPMQAVALRRLDPALDAAALALSAASHSGEPRHVEVVSRVLAEAGLTEDALGCPPDWPLGEAARLEWVAGGGVRTRLRMNCSGKHAAMLATCVRLGWSIDDYLDPAHSVQVATRETIEELAGETVAAVGVDGCGAPAFALSLRGLARATARIAQVRAGAEYEIAQAMRDHPNLVGGQGRLVTRLMGTRPGLIAKDGAEGVYVAAGPDGTVAVKIDDGAQRAAESVVVAGLDLLTPGSTDLGDAPVLGAGHPVGAIRFNAELG
jgi:L-asparaginase II